MPLGTVDLGSSEVLSDHGDEEEDDESTNETTASRQRAKIDEAESVSKFFHATG